MDDDTLLEKLVEIYRLKSPGSESILDGASARQNSIGFARLCDINGNVILKIKAADVDKELSCLRGSSQLQMNRDKSNDMAIFFASGAQIKVLSGLEEGLKLYIGSGRKVIVLSEGGDKVVDKFYTRDVVVERLGEEQKKDMGGAILSGSALGLAFGGVGAVAGATSGNYQNIIFKLVLPDSRIFACEAKQELFHEILANSKEFHPDEVASELKDEEGKVVELDPRSLDEEVETKAIEKHKKDIKQAAGCCGGCLVVLLLPFLIGLCAQLSGFKAECPSQSEVRRAMNNSPALFKEYVMGSSYKHCR